MTEPGAAASISSSPAFPHQVGSRWRREFHSFSYRPSGAERGCDTCPGETGGLGIFLRTYQRSRFVGRGGRVVENFCIEAEERAARVCVHENEDILAERYRIAMRW